MFENYLTPTGLLSRKQPQEIKNQWYIKAFQQVHGDLYDYSAVLYINSKTKVDITCKEHGIFHQTPNHHTQGDGCPKCQNNQKLQMRDFVKIAREVHGNNYDYSLSTYINAHTTVIIGCNIHGVFSKSPNNHVQGQQGCPQCSLAGQDTLYVLKCKITGLVKIGITSNIKARLVGIGGSMEVLHLYHLKNPRYHEAFLHRKYKGFNVLNIYVKTGFTEFFDLTNQQIQEIDRYVRSI